MMPLIEHNYAANAAKYVAKVDEHVIVGLLKHIGIAARSRDGSMVSCSDKVERDRVRDSFLKRKLALTAPDAELDKAVEETCQRMHDEHDKLRVTFYYLLAEKFGKLAMFANEEYATDIRHYTHHAVDVNIVTGIVKHLGIAMTSHDAMLVACSDKAELDRVRDGFMKKKLALTEPDAALDKEIAHICQKMSAAQEKSRVTFYYLIAEKHGKLGLFAPAA